MRLMLLCYMSLGILVFMSRQLLVVVWVLLLCVVSMVGGLALKGFDAEWYYKIEGMQSRL